MQLRGVPQKFLWVAGCVLVLALSVKGFQTMSYAERDRPSAAEPTHDMPGDAIPSKFEKATFGGGCFWCTEAIFARMKGVRSVVSGYSGGHVPSPTYKQVCTGTTGHAEVVQITFDPAQIAFSDLLDIFWKTHDPTTLNRQGPDVGTQYRSAIFYHNDEQRKEAERQKRALEESKSFRTPIVTEIVPFREFYPAEDYHQDYFAVNGRQPYCSVVIRPKVEKAEKLFRDKLLDARPKPAASDK